ncbi:MAG: hypothetical protein Q8J87_03725, partial [Sediminibacterium sp.]|nr:hypothetical protein [Sediminibacterium sp.]
MARRIHDEEQVFDQLTNDTTSLSNLIFNSSSAVIEQAIRNGKSGVFVYKLLAQSRIEELYWSTNKMTVPATFLSAVSNIQFVNSSNGHFLLLKKKIRLRNNDYLLVNVLPIKWSYFIENKYFKADFVDFPGLDEQYSITNNLAHTPVYSQDGIYL